MTSPYEAFRERVIDWSDYFPEVHQVQTWDWRTVDSETLDPVSRKMVTQWRDQADRMGVALADAPEDPFQMETSGKEGDET